MKNLSLEKLMNWIGVVIGVTLMGAVIFNIITYGISNTASFEF